MGFSLVGAFAVIGVSILVAMEVFTGSLLPTITDIDDSYNDMFDRTVDRVQTDITISGAIWNDPNTEITANNTGSVTLNTSDFNILIEGLLKQFTCSEPTLYPEESAVFYVVGPTNSGDVIKIVTDNGVSDYYGY